MTAAFTKAEYDRLPEGFPAQLFDGQLVREPSPTFEHQSLLMRLLESLMPLVPRGHLLPAPVDVLVDEHNVYQPDVVVLREAPPLRAHYVGTPRLAIEVLSAGTAQRDRTVKATRLLALGVEEIWIVDPEGRTIERRTHAGARVARGPESLVSRVVPGFTVAPDALFLR